jgi:hypothetical protein
MNEITNSTRSAESHEARTSKQPGPGPIRYGLPCANCRLYYAAELTVCPICKWRDRISPTMVLFRPAAML